MSRKIVKTLYDIISVILPHMRNRRNSTYYKFQEVMQQNYFIALKRGVNQVKNCKKKSLIKCIKILYGKFSKAYQCFNFYPCWTTYIVNVIESAEVWYGSVTEACAHLFVHDSYYKI